MVSSNLVLNQQNNTLFIDHIRFARLTECHQTFEIQKTGTLKYSTLFWRNKKLCHSTHLCQPTVMKSLIGFFFVGLCNFQRATVSPLLFIHRRTLQVVHTFAGKTVVWKHLKKLAINPEFVANLLWTTSWVPCVLIAFVSLPQVTHGYCDGDPSTILCHTHARIDVSWLKESIWKWCSLGENCI